MVNLEKSLFYLHEETLVGVVNLVKRITGINKGTFPFTYFGCPVVNGRKKKVYFKDLIKKVVKRLSLWKHKLLSFRERYILISNIQQSMPIYLFSAMSPSVSVINQLYKIFAKIFWANTTGAKNKHSIS